MNEKKSMKKKKTRLFKADLDKIHPHFLICDTDVYYVQLANSVYRILEMTMEDGIADKQMRKIIAVALTGYFEDIVSELGLWNGFLKVNQQLYNCNVPFIDSANEYEVAKINSEDIQLIIWFYLQRYIIDNNEGRFLNPENIMIESIADIVYDIFYDEYENAPVNTAIYGLLHKTDLTKDFYLYREVLTWLHYNSYLSMSYSLKGYQEELDELESYSKFERNMVNTLKYHIKHNCIFAQNCTPNAIKVFHWLAKITNNEDLIQICNTTKHRIMQAYEILSVKEKTLEVKSVKNNKSEILAIDLQSFGGTEYQNPALKLVTCTLVNFNNIWHVNGVASFAPNVPSSSSWEEIKEPTEKQHQIFMKNSNNMQILYFKDIAAVKNFFNLFDDSDEIDFDTFKDLENFVLFSAPEIGITITPDIALLVKDSNNPFYDANIAITDGLGILMGLLPCHKQLIDYLINNNLLADAAMNSLEGAEHGHQLLQRNMKFIHRFQQPEHFAEQDGLMG